MVAKQRIRMANEKHSKNITQRGNVAKSTVSLITRKALLKKKKKLFFLNSTNGACKHNSKNYKLAQDQELKPLFFAC